MNHITAIFKDAQGWDVSGPGAEEKWMTIYPDGSGFVRLGDERRILCVSMFHQLHCVEKMRRALDNPDDPIATLPHLQHCMNYIREMILCRGDTNLDPYQYPSNIHPVEPHPVRRCLDWNAVYRAVEDSQREYRAWKERR